MKFSLKFVERRKIKDKKAGLVEPSGLTLASDGGFWTVSDDARKLFHLDRNGKVDEVKSFKIGDKGLEGLTSHPDGRHLFAVDEESNRFLKLDLFERKVVNRRRIADMVGYGQNAEYFDDGDDNMGLEGVAWNVDTGTLFCLKEGPLGLLLEVSSDFMTVRLHAELGEDNGFHPCGKKGGKPDYSGICYDPTRDAFWIVSDKAKRLYLYAPVANRVLDSQPLEYLKGGKPQPVRDAEGVVYDPRSQRIHIVTDKRKAGGGDATLFSYEVGS